MTSMKIVQFSRLPTPLSIYVQNSSTLRTLDVHFQMNPLSPNDNQSIKRKHNPKDHYFILSGSFFRSTFVSINSLTLSGFPLTSFHLLKLHCLLFCGFIQLCMQLSQNKGRLNGELWCVESYGL